MSLLVQAARYDDLEDVVALFTAGVSLDSADSQGRTGWFGSPNSHAAWIDLSLLL